MASDTGQTSGQARRPLAFAFLALRCPRRVLAWLALAPQRLGYDTNETAAEVHALAYAHRTLRALSALFGSAAHDWRLHRQHFATAQGDRVLRRVEGCKPSAVDTVHRLQFPPVALCVCVCVTIFLFPSSVVVLNCCFFFALLLLLVLFLPFIRSRSFLRIGVCSPVTLAVHCLRRFATNSTI